jgi:hypothetical protein
MTVLITVLVLAAGGPFPGRPFPMNHELLTLGRQVRFTDVHGLARFRMAPGRYPVRAFNAVGEGYAPCSLPQTITVRRHPQRVRVFCQIK